MRMAQELYLSARDKRKPRGDIFNLPVAYRRIRAFKDETLPTLQKNVDENLFSLINTDCSQEEAIKRFLNGIYKMPEK